jgi:uncharacterized protein (DUF1697 family)
VAKYAAFLRGVNLGSNRRVSNADLCAHLEGIGLEAVSAFRGSGNVVFDGSGSASKLKSQIEEALQKELGYDVVVFLRSAKELRGIAGAEPFPAKKVAASNGKLQVALLPKKPTASAKKSVLAMETDEDRLAFGDRELYWLPSGMMRDTTLKLTEVEKLVGPWTMRTKGTIEQIVAKYFAD